MALTRRGALAGAAALGSAVALPRPARAVFGDTSVTATIVIGVVAPFTGDAQALGEQIGNGVRAAVDDANGFRGPLQSGFEVRTFDDQNLVATGEVNAQFACDDANVIGVIGHLSGRVTEAALPNYVSGRMGVICPASTYDRLTSHGYGNIVRLSVKDSSEGELGARYIAETLKPKKVVVLSQDGDYGPDVASGFVDSLKAAKIPVTPISFSWNKADFDAVVRSTMAATPDVVYLAGLTSDMGPVLPRLRAAGFTGPLLGSQGFFAPTTIAKYAAAADGLTISTSMPPLVLAPSAFRIKGDYERHYGQLTPISAFSYAAGQILIAIARRTGATDRLAVARALSSQSSFDTLIGPISFQNDGDPTNPNVYFYTVKNGQWRYIGSAYPSSFIVK